MSKTPPIPLVVECEECGRICEAPLMDDAGYCCRAAAARSLINWAEKKVVDDPELTDAGREAVRPVIIKLARDYITEVLKIDPSYILGKNKNDE